MAITQAMCTSFKTELLNGIHAFGTTVARVGTTADTFNLALYTSSASVRLLLLILRLTKYLEQDIQRKEGR